MKCLLCNVELEHAQGRHVVWRGDVAFIVEDVQFLECPTCKEKYFELEEVKRLEATVSACSDCTGIIYRQTNSGKIIPCDCISIRPEAAVLEEGRPHEVAALLRATNKYHELKETILGLMRSGRLDANAGGWLCAIIDNMQKEAEGV